MANKDQKRKSYSAMTALYIAEKTDIVLVKKGM